MKMYQQIACILFSLMFYTINVQGNGTSPSHRMKENLGEWAANMRKSVKELEQHIKEAQKEDEKFADLKSNLRKFYALLGQKTKFRFEEYDDQNEQKWILLAQEYSIKFRDSQMSYYCNKNIQDNPKESLEKISGLISGFGTNLNTFLAQIDLLSLEDMLAKYSENRDSLAKAEDWAKIVIDLEKLMENTKIDHQMIGKLKNEYEQSEVYTGYRKNVEEMMGKMEEKIMKIRKEIAKNNEEIYLMKRPFEETETRIYEIKNGKSQKEMSNLRRIVEMLILEAKMDILSNEFERNFEKDSHWAVFNDLHLKIVLKNGSGTPNYDWIVFLALGEAFLVGYDQTEQRTAKLSSENDQKAIRTKMEGIRKMAQKAVPIKNMLIEKLRVLSTNARADLDQICTDAFGKIYDKVPDQFDQMKRFYVGAIELCDNLDEIYDEIGILRSDILPEEIRDELDEEMDELLEYKISIGHAYWSARDNFAKIRAMIEALEEMKNRVEKTFYMV